jgi:S1-C subfamily serine protease
VLVAVGPEPSPLALGVAASAARAIPGGRGILAFDVAANAPGQTGVRVTAVKGSNERTAAGVRVGDVITKVGEGPTPDPAAYAKATEAALEGDGGRPGERVRLSVLRDGREVAVSAPVEAAYTRASWSARHDGFPAAFVYHAAVLPQECGGPLVGTDGKVAAVVIARIGPPGRSRPTPSDSRTYAVPADTVRRVVAELRKKIGD